MAYGLCLSIKACVTFSGIGKNNQLYKYQTARVKESENMSVKELAEELCRKRENTVWSVTCSQTCWFRVNNGGALSKLIPPHWNENTGVHIFVSVLRLKSEPSINSASPERSHVSIFSTWGHFKNIYVSQY